MEIRVSHDHKDSSALNCKFQSNPKCPKSYPGCRKTNMIFTTFVPVSTGPMVMESKVGGFAMPSGETGGGNETQNTKFFAATDNPYSWDSSSASIAGAMTIEHTSANGSTITVSNMTEPIVLDIKGLIRSLRAFCLMNTYCMSCSRAFFV